MKITERQDGERIITIEAGEWLAELVLSRGANLWKLKHSTGLEFLRTPPSVEVFREKTETWGIPVLFPPNRIERGIFPWNDCTYLFPINDTLGRHHIHGLVSRQPWNTVEVTDDSITLCFEHTTSNTSYTFFPQAFTIFLTYAFEDQTVRQTARILNTGEKPLPLGFGFHTVLQLPFGNTKGADQCKVHVTTGDWQWEMSETDLIPTGHRIPLDAKEWRDGIDTEKQSIFIHTPIASYNGFRGAVIDLPADKARIIYEVDEKFRYWVLWNFNGGKGMFCPEPQTWMVNAPNQSLPLEDTGMESLAPKKEWSVTSKFTYQPYSDTDWGGGSD